MRHWTTLNLEAIRRRLQQHEQTTSANVGGFAVPLGQPMKAVFPTTAPRRKRRRVRAMVAELRQNLKR